MSGTKVRKQKRQRPRGASAAPPGQVAVQAATPPRARPALPPKLDALLNRIPFIARRRALQFDRRDVLSARPFRNELIEWEVREPDEDARESVPAVVLRVPRRGDRWGQMLNRFFEGPSHRQVILDELGTDVWQMCDGQTSIEALIRALAKKHKLERREVELSLTLYLKTLAKRGFIGLHVERE
jgi:hypothetical protein